MYLKSKKFNLFRFDLVIKKLLEIIKDCSAFFNPWEKRFYKLFVASILLYFKGGFSTKDIFRFGLFASSGANGFMDNNLTIKNLLKLQCTLNHPSLMEVTYNKIIFYNYARQLNLPNPELYALFFRGTTGWSYRKPIITSEEEWINFIKEDLPQEFVVKPSKGRFGEDINIYTKEESGLLDGFGKYQSEKYIYKKMMENKKYDSFILQERLRNHKEFFKLSSSEYLHCVRIITLIDSLGQFKILHGQLNLVVGQNIVSQGGNLKITISAKDGCLEDGFLLNRAEGGFKMTSEHPETGLKFAGFRLPLWKEVLSLSEEAAYKFLPLRTVGWDLAITEKDVKLIEANAYYGIPFTRQMSNFIKNLTDGSKIQNQQ
jgi:hypothetical protein